MKFFFPDSQDQINPLFDMQREEHSPQRVRQRDDRYAHEVLSRVPFDGLLISKAIVDGWSQGAGKYSAAQRARFYREGVVGFFRIPDHGRRALQTLGDCGAFAYVEEEAPPYSVDDVIDFYEGGQFDLGISPDHVILGFQTREHPDEEHDELRQAWGARQALTLQLAGEFLQRHRSRACHFVPIGAAQGWSPESYAKSVLELQRMGYSRIAIGGMVPLKTPEILASLRAVSTVRDSQTQLHLLGVTRIGHLPEFASFGVTSFDSTSPFRQAFMDADDNYHWHGEHFMAIRVPQVDGNARLKMKIRAGQVSQADALQLEQSCLATLRAYDTGGASVSEALEVLHEYAALLGKKDTTEAYRRTLESMAWRECQCGLCASTGIEIIIFRGSERNKRRGFHNLYVFGERLRQSQLKASVA